jgi:DNA modification methylase
MPREPVAPRGGRLKIEYLAPTSLIPDPRNSRKHPPRQIARLKAVVEEMGFNSPILVDGDLKIIAGHARFEVARALGMESVPCLRLTHLSQAQKIALAVADNKLGDMSQFDPKLLARQLAALCAIDFPVELTGFDTAEVDILLEPPSISPTDPADTFPEPDARAECITQVGDLWQLGPHRLLCASALEEEAYTQLLDGNLADMVFTDPPYNLTIQGHVSGLGQSRHSEFAMASGEMSREEYMSFLSTFMRHLKRFSTNGSIHFHCIDWRHLQEILAAGDAVYAELKALCVWNKTNGGMGSFYRSKHELVLVYKNGTKPHINNIDLGRKGRYRTNVWDYPGANAFRPGREDDLAVHPTVKPVSLIADAMRDCSKRGSLILDPFLGSGSTILAAERTGRKAAAIELEPRFVDTAVRRWQSLTGKTAVRSVDGKPFDEISPTLQAEEVRRD